MCLRPSSLKRISPVSPSISTWKLNRNQRVGLFSGRMPAFVNIVWKKGWIYITFQDFFNGFVCVTIYENNICNSMRKNESKMWNRIFSFEFSRKSNLKNFQTRVNSIQCPYERIIDKGLYYLPKICKKKNLEKNFSIFKALRSTKSNFWIWKLFDPLRDFNFLLRGFKGLKTKNSFLITILPNEKSIKIYFRWKNFSKTS